MGREHILSWFFGKPTGVKASEPHAKRETPRRQKYQIVEFIEKEWIR